jgi:1,4-alpha-glucan branching enzyme
MSELGWPPGYVSLVLHAHLPFVRHPDHEKFLEESWLFEAVTETYLPLIQILDGWRRDGMDAPLTFSLSPPLCAMLLDPLLRERYARHLDSLIELAEKEIHRTHWDRAFRELAWMYHHRFSLVRESWRACGGNLVNVFKQFQEEGRIEIITTAATHGLLPLLANHPPSLRGQILTARDHYRVCFGRDPRGIWLPECAYVEGIEQFLQEANIRWFILDSHGVLQSKPRPRFGTFAPVYTPNGIAAFGRDFDSSRQVWSQREGYPGDARLCEAASALAGKPRLHRHQILPHHRRGGGQTDLRSRLRLAGCCRSCRPFSWRTNRPGPAPDRVAGPAAAGGGAV